MCYERCSFKKWKVVIMTNNDPNNANDKLVLIAIHKLKNAEMNEIEPRIKSKPTIFSWLLLAVFVAFIS